MDISQSPARTSQSSVVHDGQVVTMGGWYEDLHGHVAHLGITETAPPCPHTPDLPVLWRLIGVGIS